MEKEVGTETILKAIDEADPLDRPGCPMTWLLSVISGKWAFPVLYQLYVADGPLRFARLQRAIGRVTQKELTKTLRDLERDGFVTRAAYAEVPPRVEYGLTERAASLCAALCPLGDWAAAHRPRTAVDPAP